MKWTAAMVKWCLIAVLMQPSVGFGFTTSTHELINETAASLLLMSDSGISFDNFLTSQLLFAQGLDTPLNGQSISRWLGTGGVAEDQYMPEILGQKLAELAGGVTRSPRHFHTPLRTWDQSGLNLGGIQYESSPRWAQLADQGFTGKAAWGDARSTYFQALTATDPGQRATLFGNTFKILGQLMHLVADMASVAHARNDQHALGDPFETFMGKPTNQSLIAGFQGMDPSYVRFSPTNDAVATVPVARLWDTDTYNGSNPDITAQTTTSGATVGLAEFTSANFFSRSTVSKIAGADPVLPYPAIDQLVPGPIELYEPTGNLRQYWSKGAGQGIAITHMAAECAFNLFEPSTWQRFSLDDKVFEDYAQQLLPRAIGYSAGLVDYFFRGTFGGFAIYDGPSAADASYPVDQPPTVLTVDNLANGSVEDAGAGTLTLVLTYSGQIDTSETFPQYVVSNSISTSLSRTDQMTTFTFDSPLPFPATFRGQAAYTATLVYRGPLGLENDAVVLGGFCAIGVPWGITFIHGKDADPPWGTGQEIVWTVFNCVQ